MWSTSGALGKGSFNKVTLCFGPPIEHQQNYKTILVKWVSPTTTPYSLPLLHLRRHCQRRPQTTKTVPIQLLWLLVLDPWLLSISSYASILLCLVMLQIQHCNVNSVTTILDPLRTNKTLALESLAFHNLRKMWPCGHLRNRVPQWQSHWIPSHTPRICSLASYQSLS